MKPQALFRLLIIYSVAISLTGCVAAELGIEAGEMGFAAEATGASDFGMSIEGGVARITDEAAFDRQISTLRLAEETNNGNPIIVRMEADGSVQKVADVLPNSRSIRVGNDFYFRVSKEFCFTKADWVDVRVGPGENFEVVQKLRKGNFVYKLGESVEPDGTWYKVRINKSTNGYIRYPLVVPLFNDSVNNKNNIPTVTIPYQPPAVHTYNPHDNPPVNQPAPGQRVPIAQGRVNSSAYVTGPVHIAHLNQVYATSFNINTPTELTGEIKGTATILSGNTLVVRPGAVILNGVTIDEYGTLVIYGTIHGAIHNHGGIIRNYTNKPLRKG